jgi:hypothetical protein
LKDLKLIDLNAIYSFQIKVTQEILKSHLLTFIRTHIQNKDILLSDMSYFSYYFHPPSLSYEIIVYEKPSIEYIQGLYLCKSYLKSNLNTLQSVVFILDKYFCFYYKNTLITLKKIKKANNEDIKSYIEQAYKVSIEKFVDISYTSLLEYQQEYKRDFLKSDEKEIFPVITQRSFRYFQYFTLIATCLFVVLFYDIISTHNETQELKLKRQNKYQVTKNNSAEKLYQQFQHQMPIEKMLLFFKDMEKHSISIELITYEQNSFFAKVSHTDKRILRKLLGLKLTYLEIYNISYEKQNNIYTMRVRFDNS